MRANALRSISTAARPGETDVHGLGVLMQFRPPGAAGEVEDRAAGQYDVAAGRQGAVVSEHRLSGVPDRAWPNFAGSSIHPRRTLPLRPRIF